MRKDFFWSLLNLKPLKFEIKTQRLIEVHRKGFHLTFEINLLNNLSKRVVLLYFRL